MKNCQSKKIGFTLIELLVEITIIAISTFCSVKEKVLSVQYSHLQPSVEGT